MSLSTQPYKGARDFYPEDKRVQSYIFWVLRNVVEGFGYQEYDSPLIEPLDIYAMKSGEEIINEQVYSFVDRGGRQVAIRPEMTPSVSRMVAGRRQELPYPLRLYSIPNLWRYERPQRGRLREHYQLNVDIFGVDGIEADHEIITIADAVLKSFGAKPDDYVIRINSRQLVDKFLKEYMDLADNQIYETSKLIDRWHKIERADFHKQAQAILGDEKKYKELVGLMESRSLDSLPEAVRKDKSAGGLAKLVEMLRSSGVQSAGFDFSVIRGMDYYNGIVFEVFDTAPDNIRSMFGGGRYDGLVELFGAEHLPVVGFGMGDVSLLNFLQAHKLEPVPPLRTDAAILLAGTVYDKAQQPLQYLRGRLLRLAVDISGRKLEAQLKSAVKSGVRYAVVIGEQELQSNRYKLRDLEKGTEEEMALDKLADSLLERRVHKVARK